MRGMYRRIIWFIPTKGPGSAIRRVKHCNTLAGSNIMHQFEDLGRPGYLRVRDRSCHPGQPQSYFLFAWGFGR